MYDKILVPLDGSGMAETVLHDFPELLRGATEVVLLHAVAYPVGFRRDPAVVERAYEYLEDVQQRLTKSGVGSRILVAIGTAAETILEAAESEGVSLVAMTTRGRTGVPKWMFGSVAEKVLRASSHPLLLVHPREPLPGRPLEVKQVVVPLDGSALSLRAASHANELARSLGARLLLVHVFEKRPRAYDPEPPERPLAEAARIFGRAGVAVDVEYREGDPAEGIVKFSEEAGPCALAMATHGRTGVSRWVLGSVAEKVLQAVRKPILLVRPAGIGTAVARRDQQVARTS